jgi:hypothetical protein
MSTITDGLARVMKHLAQLNTEYFHDVGPIPAMVLTSRPGEPVNVLSLDDVDAHTLRRAVVDAYLTVTCVEGHLTEMSVDAPLPNPDTIAQHPDARHCLVYLAQARDGTRACAVQYILRPEHGRATLAPLKVIEGRSVDIMGPDIADLTRPGRAPRRDMH